MKFLKSVVQECTEIYLGTDKDANRHVCYRCRAPIASLDCMEEFSTGSGLSGLADKESSLTKEQLLLGGLTHSAPGVPLQLSRSTNATPGLRYRNLGKSGLRVSNIGLGE